MPKVVEFADLGSVEFPDEMSNEAIHAAAPIARRRLVLEREARVQQQTYAEERQTQHPLLWQRALLGLSTPEELLSFGATTGRGFAGSLASVPEMAGRYAETLPPEALLGPQGYMSQGGREWVKQIEAARAKETPEEKAQRIESSPGVQLGKAIREKAEQYLPVDESLKQTFLFGEVPQALGTTGAALATAPLGPGAVYGVTFTSEASDAYEREMQRQKDAGEAPDPEKAMRKATAYGGLATLIESKFGTGRIYDRLRKAMGRLAPPVIEDAVLTSAKPALKQVAKELAKEIPTGFGEEFSQEALEGWIVEGAPNWKEALRSGAVGAIVQGPTALTGPVVEGARAAWAGVKPLSEKDITKLATAKNIPWDNDPTFLKFTEAVTGKQHLSDLNWDELLRMYDVLQRVPAQAPKGPSKRRAPPGEAQPQRAPAAISPTPQTTEVQSATTQGAVQGSVPVERAGTDAQRKAAEAGIGYRIQPAAGGQAAAQTTEAPPVAAAPLPPGAKFAVPTTPTSLAALWEAYDGTGEITTVRELANALEGMIVEGLAPESLQEPLDQYRAALEEDFRQYAGRGDMESEEKLFTDAIQREAAKESGAKFAVPLMINREVGANVDFISQPSDADATAALDTAKRPLFGKARSLEEGTPVALRIDIPSFNRTGRYVVTIHQPAGAKGGPGKVIGYDTIGKVRNPRFVVTSRVDKIYSGETSKFPTATVDGEFVQNREIPADINQWTPVGMDPKEHAFFYDKRTDQPVISGDEAISVGNTVFVKNPVYGERSNFKFAGPRAAGHTVESATTAINQFLGTAALPSRVQVVHDEDAPYGGYFLNGEVIINAPRTADPVKTLMEEGLHGVWSDPALQKAWKAWLAAVSPEDIAREREKRKDLDVSEETLREEAAIARLLENRPGDRKLIQRIIDAIRAAFRRVFGIEVPAESRDIILAAAVEFLRSGQHREGGIRYAAPTATPARLVFENLAQLEQIAGAPGLEEQQKQTIYETAGAQAGLVGEDTYQQIKMWDQSNDAAENFAAAKLDPLVGFYELGPGSQISALAPENRDVAAVAVTHTDQSIKDLRTRLDTDKTNVAEELEEVRKELPDKAVREIETLFAKSQVEQLVGGMEEQLKNIAQTTAKTFPAAQKAMLDRMSNKLASLDTADMEAIRVGLLNIAKQIPESILSGAEAVTDNGAVVVAGTPGTEVGSRSVINWTRAQKPAVASAEIVDWMTLSSDAARSPMAAYPNLVKNLLKLKTIANNHQAALQQIEEYTHWVRDNYPKLPPNARRVTLLQFARRYADWRASHQEAVEMARQLSSKLRRLDDKLRGLTMAVDEVDRMTGTSIYQAKLKQATDQLQASEANLSHRSEGRMVFEEKGPLTGLPPEHRTYDPYPMSAETVQANVDNTMRMVQRIDEWLKGEEASRNPASAAGWKQIHEWLVSHAMLHAGLQSNFAQFGFRLGGTLTNILVSLGFPGTKQGLKRLMGLAAQKTVGMAMNNVGNVSDGQSDIFKSPEFGPLILTQLVHAAARSHNPDVKPNDLQKYINETWLPGFNKLAGRDQSAGGRRMSEGSRLPNDEKVTPEDMVILARMKKFTDAIRNNVSRNPRFQEIIDAPLRIVSDELGQYRLSAAPGYLNVTPRTFSSQGLDFAREWQTLKGTEAIDVADDGTEIPSQEKRVAYVNSHLFFLNDWWSTSNPEWVRGQNFRGDELVAQAHLDRIDEQERNKGQNLNFNSVDEYATWIGDLRAEANESDPIEEFIKAKREFIEQVDAVVEGVLRNSKVEAREAKVENEASLIATFRNTGKGPMTSPRGEMVAPDFFYDYTYVTPVNQANLRGKAMLPFWVRLYNELQTLDEAVDRVIQERKAYLETRKTPGLMKEFKARRAVRKEDIAAARAGRFVAPLEELIVFQRALKAELSRLGANLTETKDGLYDSTRLDMARRLESLFSLPLLFTESATLNNINSALFGGALLDIQAGNIAWTHTHAWDTGKIHFRVMKKLAVLVSKNKPIKKLLAEYPEFFNKLSKALIQWTEQEAAFTSVANLAGIGTPTNVREQIRAIRQSPETYGDVETRELSSLQKTGNYAMALMAGFVIPEGVPVIGGVPVGLEAFRVWSQLVDNVTLPYVVAHAVKNLDRLQAAMYAAMEKRASGETQVENWDDPTQPLTPFTPEELGMPDNKTIDTYRRWLLAPGNLEIVALRYWQKARQEPDEAARLKIPLLTQPQMNSVVRDVMRDSGNPIDEVNRMTAWGTTGNKGLLWRFLTRFSNWPVNMQSVIQNLTTRDMRDLPAKQWLQILRAVALLLIAIFVSIFYLEEKAVVRGVISHDQPSTPRLAGVEGAGDFARLGASAMASGLIPYYGEWVARAMGTSANKPLADMNGSVPVLGLVNSIVDTATKVVQSRDPFLPLADWVRKTMPYSRPIFGAAERLGIPPFAGEAAARQASRAIRSAAPADLEKTTASGGGVGGRLTPLSGIMRRALDAAYAGDEAGLKTQIEKAVAYKVGQGQSEKDARRSVQQSLESRTPSRRVLGKLPTAEEEARIISRMTPAQRTDYERSKEAFATVGRVTGHPVRLTARGAVVSKRRALGRASLTGLRRRKVGLGRRPGLSRGGRRRRVQI